MSISISTHYTFFYIFVKNDNAFLLHISNSNALVLIGRICYTVNKYVKADWGCTMNCRNYSNSDLLVQVAQLYYMENRSQAEIAEIIHVSRPQVSKLLMKARELGIVTITVTPPSDRFRNYEAMLCHLYGIESCGCRRPFSETTDAQKVAAKEIFEIINK